MLKPVDFARQAEQFSDAEWFEFLDELDEVSRRRRQHAQDSAEPLGNDKDDVAAWIARRHLLADNAIREIWYLPTNSPPSEIRLLELNGRLAGNGWGIEPIDFALDVQGAHFKLLVADITSEELEPMKNGKSSQLPTGWSLAEPKIWRRGE
ncbi:MAG TPA: hypothetical protein VFE47_09640 [Tepidisphaeraceae bacterium]|jgi:hypothetical protein|nr:hypothetical protein [Tepidisphaeraceae bacterium]